MKKSLIVLIILILNPSICLSSGTCDYDTSSCAGTSPWTADSAGYNDVNYCVNTCAAEDDTVIVPSGTVTWTSTLTIGKGLILQGNGVGSTVITREAANVGVITYSTAGTVHNFRVTGFTLTNTLGSGIRLLAPTNSTDTVTNVRIDNNSITASSPIYVVGSVFGVIDHNTMTGSYLHNESGAGLPAFLNLENVFGTANNLYYEDNTITYTSGNAFTSGHGSRYLARYNTIVKISGVANVFDVHGNMPNPVPTNMIFEGYGNDVNLTGTSSSQFAYLCGGKSIMFYNKITGNNSIKTQVSDGWFDDMYRRGTVLSSTANTVTFVSSNDNLPADADNAMNILITAGPGLGEEKLITGGQGTKVVSIAPDSWSTQPTSSSAYIAYYNSGTYSGLVQKPNTTYIWNNRRGDNTLSNAFIGFDYIDWNNSYSNAVPTIVEDREFWQDDAVNCAAGGADCTSGVGCGTLANIPAACTTGVGYWATDQSCSDLTDLVGASHTSNISGTLYKCTNTNTWTSYYTPYKYPHPLVEDTVFPTISNPIPYGTQVCTGPTQSVTLGLSTEENATCKYDTVDHAYDVTSGVTFTTTGGTVHSGVTTLASAASYTFYGVCVDESGNTNTAGTPWTVTIGTCGSPPQGPVTWQVGGGAQSVTVGGGGYTLQVQ